MAILLHELWLESETEQTFCLAGPRGDSARRLLKPGSRLVWTVEAGSHFEAMTKYYQHMGWGVYKPEPNCDVEPYPEDWIAAADDSEI